MKKSLLIITCFVILLAVLGVSCTTYYQYSASVQPSGGGKVEPSSGTYESGAAVNVTAIPEAGYRFNRWEGGASDTSPSIKIMMDKNVNLIANFTRLFSLSTSVNPEIGGSITPNTGIYDEGKQVTLVASPNKDYKFIGWAGDITGSSPSIELNMDSNKQISATFEKLTFDLQTQANPPAGGRVSGSGNFEVGTKQEIIARPAAGYRFDRWSGDVTGNVNPTIITIDNTKNVTANFIKVNKLTVTVPDDVKAVVSPTSGVYDEGTKVTLTAKATAAPFAFDHWGNTDNDKANPTTVTMSSDKSVTVFFKKLTAGLTVSDAQFIPAGATTSFGIDLKQYEWVEGDIWAPYYTGEIVDPTGKVIRDLGVLRMVTFSFSAEVSGQYKLVLHNNHYTNASYNMKYLVYHW